MTVAFEELAGSPTIGVGIFGTSAQRVFRVAWSDWPELVSELIGSYRSVGSGFVFVPPLEFPGLSGVVVAQLEVVPMDPDNPDGSEVSTLASGTNAYPAAGAKVTATYETIVDVLYPPRPDLPAVPNGTYLTYRADLGAEFLTVPGRAWHWDVTGSPPLSADINPGILIPTGTFHLVWYRVAMPNWTAIRQLRGKVNDVTFVGAPAGTVLFLGARAVRQFQFSDLGGFWRVEYLFSERAIDLNSGGLAGWNYFYKEVAAGGEHWVAIKDDSGDDPYDAGDFSPLFQFGSG